MGRLITQGQAEDIFETNHTDIQMALKILNTKPKGMTEKGYPKNLYDRDEIGKGLIELYKSRRNNLIEKANVWVDMMKKVVAIMKGERQKDEQSERSEAMRSD